MPSMVDLFNPGKQLKTPKRQKFCALNGKNDVKAYTNLCIKGLDKRIGNGIRGKFIWHETANNPPNQWSRKCWANL